MKKQLLTLALAAGLALCSFSAVFADETDTAAASTTVVENCGAYLFYWRPVDCGNGQAFAILVGQNTISESDVILNRGYDYAYTLYSNSYPQPWGTVPDLMCVDGIWGIPENWSLLPEGSQPTLRIVLLTNNKNMDTNERYVDVVHLPSGVDTSALPAEVRKYLINTDGSDAGAYNGTVTPGWEETENGWMYRKADNTFVTNSWLQIDGSYYYMDENGIMLADTITPDGRYVNSSGERTSYIPGWIQDEKGWRYVQKNGYYAASTWIEDTDGQWYYFNIGAYMEADTTTPDGYYVGADGAWDGNAASVSWESIMRLGPGVVAEMQAEGSSSDEETAAEETDDETYESEDASNTLEEEMT